ncbi:hypothetical protein B0O99DRAFT_644128 [Bisporella sp. PMI_857]|nr:hypothetical protein B0O99DRAFT_644128 [Bisporella sp. PMI_857]
MASSSTANPQLTFHCFPFLPFELKSEVFHCAILPLSAPRIIRVQSQIDSLAPFHSHKSGSRCRFSTRSRFVRFFDNGPPPPDAIALLWACRESRAIAKEYFDFTMTDIPQQISSDVIARRMTMNHSQLRNPGILFQPNSDVIYMSASNFTRVLIHATSIELNMSNIKIVRMDHYLFRHYLISKQLFEGWGKEEPPFLAGLKKLIVVGHLDEFLDGQEHSARKKHPYMYKNRCKEIVEARLKGYNVHNVVVEVDIIG